MSIVSFGWEPGTIGEFDRLNRIAVENRGFLQEMADSSSAGLLGRVVAAGTLQLRNLTSGASPVDTGTLQSAHRGDVAPYPGGGVEGSVFIDPTARNPVYGGQPAMYGEIVAMLTGNWFNRVADMHGETVLIGMEETIIERIEDLWL